MLALGRVVHRFALCTSLLYRLVDGCVDELDYFVRRDVHVLVKSRAGQQVFVSGQGWG